MSLAKYVSSPFDRISTRSLSSPKSVVRIHSAPSASYRCPSPRSFSSVSTTLAVAVDACRPPAR